MLKNLKCITVKDTLLLIPLKIFLLATPRAGLEVLFPIVGGTPVADSMA